MIDEFEFNKGIVSDFSAEVKIAQAKSGTSVQSVSTYGNIWVNIHEFRKAGDRKGGHKHSFDHLHFVYRGSVEIEVHTDENTILRTTKHTAPSWVKVPKDHYHTVTALEDDSAGICIQSLNNRHGEAMDTDYIGDILGSMIKVEEG